MSPTMLAARAHPGETEFKLEDIEIPELGPDEVLVRVRASAISQRLLMLWQIGMLPILPSVLSAWIAGEVAAVGSDVSALELGGRVRVNPVISCGTCAHCLAGRIELCDMAAIVGFTPLNGAGGVQTLGRYHDGGLAQYVRVPASAIDQLPAGVSFAAGARVHDLAVAIHALRAANVQPQSTVVLTGATGAVGALTARLAPHFGIERVIAVGRASARLEAIRELDPSRVQTVALDELGDWSEGGLTAAIRALAPEGVDAAIDYLDQVDASSQLVMALRRGGSAAFLGANRNPIAVPVALMMLNFWQVAGARAALRDDSRLALELLGDGRLQIEDLITHRFPLEDINQAAALVRERSDEKTWLVAVDIGGTDVAEAAASERLAVETR
jgi:threonine dehydrogenase-like Zn-dependent dehydrogenase